VNQKYFIAIVPPEPFLSNITAIKMELFENYGSKGALRSPAHITLHMPFSWDDEKEEKLITNLESFKIKKIV
jgi:2'-5' RNA ligase